MNRRRFLKYAGATAAVVGASALGLNYLTGGITHHQTTSTTTTQNSSQTIIPATTNLTTNQTTSIPTPTSRLTDLKLQLFLDRNGDGVQESNEELITDPILLVGIGNNNYRETLHPEKGAYWARNIPVGGAYRPLPTTGKSRNVSLSKDKFVQISDYAFTVDSLEPSLALGWMDGFVTLGFDKSVPIRIISYPDLDSRVGQIRDWEGGRRTYDGHGGTDFEMNREQVKAGAPGVIYAAASGWPKNSLFADDRIFKVARNFIMIDHLNGYITTYNHLTKLFVADAFYGHGIQRVERGQVIGISGETPDISGNLFPHLHMGCWVNYDDKDLFRDLFYEKYVYTPSFSNRSNPVSLWTIDNDPQYP